MIFSNAGMEAKAAYSADQAIALVAQWIPHAAIIDVQLPGMNGIDLAIQLKARYPDCALTLFSGHTSTADLLEQAEQHGYSLDVLAKPVHPAALLRRVTLQLAGAGNDEP